MMDSTFNQRAIYEYMLSYMESYASRGKFKMLKTLFNWLLIIGLILLGGRIVTAICVYFDIPFTTFFKDYALVSVIILIIGIIGSETMKKQEKR